MSRPIKLIILIILSSSVYFIYRGTKNSVINITNIGDSLALGINSYDIKESSYIDFYNEALQSKNIKTYINNDYSKSDLTIEKLLELIKNTPKLKKVLLETDILIVAVGYNDLTYKLTIADNMNKEKLDKIIKEISLSYTDMLNEIKKYYKNDVIVIGQYNSNKEDYYLSLGIRKLNEAISTNEDIEFIDTYYLLSNKEKYFPNPKINFPNNLGYKEISNKIIEKTLENNANF